MEGIGMYLTTAELRRLTADLCAHFDEVNLLIDVYSPFAAKMSKYRNPVKDVGVTKVYGIDRPEVLQNDTFVFVKEQEMIPKKYVNELKGMEKFLFASLYAGGLSKKLYRLFAYQKI